MTGKTKDSIRLVIGWLFLALGVYTLIAFGSYVFTWTIDQSLLDQENMLSNLVTAKNSGGKLGLLWSNLLIGRFFGIGAFIIPFFFIALAIYCLRITKFRIVPVFFFSAFGCIVLSIACQFVFSFTTLDMLFGAGVGGSYGYYVNRWLINLLGTWGTGLLLFFMLTVWLVPVVFRKRFRSADKVEEKPVERPIEKPVVIPAKEEPVVEPFPMPILEREVELPVNPVDEIGKETPLVVIEKGVEESTAGTLEKYDPKLDLSHYKYPPLTLLEEYKDRLYEVSHDELERNNQKIVETLRVYKIPIEKISALPGPTVTLYKIVPSPGVRISQITRLVDDIMMSLAARGVRIIAPIPGTNMVGIEVANDKPSIVPMRTILDSTKFKESKDDLPIVLGKSITNEIYSFDLTRMPHLLVAGATGQGKSVALNAILASLLYKMHPAYLKLVLIDPKMVELTLYSKIEKHFLAKLPDSDQAIITDTKKVVYTLRSLCVEMDARLVLFNKASVRNIKEYNTRFLDRKLNPEHGHRFMPFIVVVIDEFADLIMTAGREVEEPLTRLAQKARSVGIHLVIATQRPTTNIITGTIKANFPARIAFRVISQIDSRTIIDEVGANQLVGRGDMLVSTGGDLVRVQCAFIDTPEVERLVDFIGKQPGYASAYDLPEYVEQEGASASGNSSNHNDGQRDELFAEAARLVVQAQYGSTSLLQRKMNLGYNRAGRIMDQLEEAGIVGPSEGSKPRQVLLTSFESLELIIGKE